MKDRQPWSVRGVTREARAKAARAASQQHQTIGEWVTQTLIAAADRDLGLASDAPAPADAPATNLPARQEGQQKELTQALGALVRYLEKTAQSGDVARRLERTEHVLMGRIEQMAAGLYSLMQTMETRTVPVVEGESGTPLLLPDQSRLADAVEKVVDAEASRQDQMAAIAEALTKLAAKVGEPAVPPTLEAADDSDEADVEPVEAPEPDEPDVLDEEPLELVEPADTDAAEETEPQSTAEAMASLIAGARDDGDQDVVAAIRARNANRSPATATSNAASKRSGFLGRLFGRD